MIIVPIMGGLGNQMFQYAFGRAMATELDRHLVLDLTMMPTGRPPYLRRYELPRLPIRSVSSIAAPGPETEVLASRPRVGRLGRNARGLVGRRLVREPKEGILLRPDELPAGLAVCFGYWQSHHYFDEIRHDIRHELTPPVAAGGPVAELLDRMAGMETVLVHVRRGDYSSDAKILSIHGLQTVNYYQDAVASIAAEVGGPLTALVVSDDPAWAVQNLEFDVPTVHVEAERPLTTLESLALMSRCTHHVIANSSFSWWGAWLASHDDQRVIRPRRWFATREVDDRLRFPSHWRVAG